MKWVLILIGWAGPKVNGLYLSLMGLNFMGWAYGFGLRV